MLLQLLRYDFHITYTPGKNMFIADTLSHVAVKDQPHEETSDLSSERVVYGIQAMV